MVQHENDPILEESAEDSKAFFARKDLIHYIALIGRPGVQDCMVTLEHAHYLPGTARNDLFSLRLQKWVGQIWMIASIPVAEKRLMEASAAAHGLRVADGLPTLFHGGSVEYFPVQGENIFTLENIAGHPVYKKGRL